MSSLLKNTGFSIITFASRIISGSVVYIVLARLLSLNDFGLLSFGATFAGLLTVFAEFGFSLMAQRDIPQKRFELNLYVFNTFIQKIALSFLAICGGLIYLFVFFSGRNVYIGIIFIINAIITSNNMYLFSVFRAKNKFKIESYLSLLYSIIVFALTSIFIWKHFDVIFIAYGLLIGRFIQLIVLIIIYIRTFNVNLKIDSVIQKYLAKHSFSFGAHYIIGIFYFTIDNQLIAYYWGNDALAIYQAYFKIVLILLSVNELLNNVFIPFLASKYNKNSNSFINIARLSNRVILTLGLGLFLFLILFSEYIVEILYTDKYYSSLTIVIPLSFVLLFRIVSSIYSVLLTISNHQIMRVVTVLASLVVNIILNFIFIPKYGFMGAAVVSMITHFVLVLLYIIFAYKYINSFLVDFKIIAFGLFTVVLAIGIYYSKLELNMYESIGVFVFWILSLYFIYSKEQISGIKSIFFKEQY